MIEIITNSADETREAGYKLGKLLKRGDIVCLKGNLGSGKTVFTGGIAEALGIKGYITSPTFSIVNEYEGIMPLYHFDVYRITDSDEMFEIGFEEYLGSCGAVVIEWAETIDSIIPADRISVSIEKDCTEEFAYTDRRIINIKFSDDRNDKLTEQSKLI